MKARLLWLLVLGSSLASVAYSQYEKWSELRDAVQPYRESLISASVLYDSEKWYAQSYMKPTTPDDSKKFLGDLLAIEKLMTGTYAGVVAPPGFSEKDIMGHPESWLEIAKARNEILAKVRDEANADKAAAEVKFIEGIIQAIKSHDGWGLNENGLKIVMGQREDARQKLCGGQKFDGWDTACDKLMATAKELAPKVRSYANYSDSSISERIKSGWQKNYPERKIIKIATAKSDWTIVKNSLGVPKYRSKGVAVQYKVSGFDYIIEQTISILEDYVGNGSYKYRPTAQVSDYRILAPKTN